MKDLWDHPRHNFGIVSYNHVLQGIMTCCVVNCVRVGREEESQAQCESVFNLGLVYKDRLYDKNLHPFPDFDADQPFEAMKGNVLLAMAAPPETEEDAGGQVWRHSFRPIAPLVFSSYWL